MGNSYPDRTNASGVWKINEISKNKVTHNTYPDGSKRALFAGGNTGSASDIIEHIQLVSTGNGTDFGNLTVARRMGGTTASSTRAVFANGADPSTDVIDYVQYATLGNASDFGDAQTSATGLLAGGANSTRAISSGGLAPSNTDTINLMTISTTANATDFGNLTDARSYLAGMANDTRQITSGGLDPGFSNIIDFVEIATTGNAIDFGNLTSTPALATNCASRTRGINCGGTAVSGGGTNLNIIDFIEISSTGNAADFGDLTGTQRSQSSFGSNTRMVTAGGQGPGTTKMEAIQIASLGNATDFSDSLSGTTENGRGTSDGKRGVFHKGAVQNVLETKNIFNGGAAVDFGD